MTSYAFPPLYRPWLDEVLGAPVISEPRATCNECVMCNHADRTARNDYTFNPNTKCCAYHPSLPNYIVGAILSDNDPEFSAAKEQFIRGAMLATVSPIGMNPPYFTKLFYKLKPFGKHEQILCPFYIHEKGGLCGIWQYRNARCSTWFCKHERGRTGLIFWNALEEMMAFAEQKLAEECVTELPVILPEHPENVREAIWGNWTHREIEYFVACWEKIRPFNWKDVMAVGGDELRALVVKTKAAYARLDSPPSQLFLRKNNFTSEEIGDETVRVWGYSSFNPVDLPREIVDALDHFDGRDIEIVLAEIQSQKHLQMDADLLRKLIDYEILISGAGDLD